MNPAAILSLAIVGCVLAAVAAYLGFAGRGELLGVDLGTTYSSIAIRHGASGVRVATDARGRASTRSVFAVGDAGEVLVGRAAEALLRLHPHRGVVDGKRVIGRRVGDAMVESEAVRHGGRLITHPHTVRRRVSGREVPRAKRGSVCREGACDADLAFVVPLPSSLTGSQRRALAAHPCFAPDDGSIVDVSTSPPSAATIAAWSGARALHSLTGNWSDVGLTHVLLATPQAISCCVLRELIVIADANVGHNGARTAMAATPADFGAAQREATGEAFARAGLKVVRTLPEPVAAALAYGLNKPGSGVHTVLVFDMGGGTLDVAVLFAGSGNSGSSSGGGGSGGSSFTVIGAAGDNALGGEDVDDLVKGLLLQQLSSSSSSSQGGEGGGEQHVECTTEALSLEAERVKLALCGDGGVGALEEVSWSCGVGGNGGSGILTRATFEAAASALFDRAMRPVHDALQGAGVSAGEVDEVVLVGGSSRLPGIRTRLRALFGRELRSSVDPDLAVALGAAAAGD